MTPTTTETHRHADQFARDVQRGALLNAAFHYLAAADSPTTMAAAANAVRAFYDAVRDEPSRTRRAIGAEIQAAIEAVRADLILRVDCATYGTIFRHMPDIPGELAKRRCEVAAQLGIV